MPRSDDLRQFYDQLALLECKLGGKHILENSNGHMGWPKRGVYFFFETGEIRTDTGVGLRVVRVGTHALQFNSRTTLWDRLRQHRGNLTNGGGNHRGSVFRSHVGRALIKKGNWPPEIQNTWGIGANAPHEVRQMELPLEQEVSHLIRKMPFLWLAVEDEPGPDSLRGVIERNAIALLSNLHANNKTIDPPSPTWLGKYSGNETIRLSDLWNVDHAAAIYNPMFLNTLDALINQI